MVHFLIVGSASDTDFYFCDAIAAKIASIESNVTYSLDASLEVDYLVKLKKYRLTIGGGFISHKKTHVVLQDGAYIGDIKVFIALAEDKYGFMTDEVNSVSKFNRNSREETAKLLKVSGRPSTFLDFIDGAKKRTPKTPAYGKIVIELFSDFCPAACDNFYKLCVGGKKVAGTDVSLHYLGSSIHRIVPGAFVQLGDIVDGTGANSVSSLACEKGMESEKVRDESFSIDFGCPEGGIIGMSNSGPHGNGSQFFITFGPCEWMNGQFVGIGRVVQGFDVLEQIAACPCNNQFPISQILVGSCGKGN